MRSNRGMTYFKKCTVLPGKIGQLISFQKARGVTKSSSHFKTCASLPCNNGHLAAFQESRTDMRSVWHCIPELAWACLHSNCSPFSACQSSDGDFLGTPLSLSLGGQ
eukprot:1160228-Pelagomonas_calceolata.AAC.4